MSKSRLAPHSQASEVWHELVDRFAAPLLLHQLIVLVVALGIAGFVYGRLQRRNDVLLTAHRWSRNTSNLQQVLLPLLAWLVIEAGKGILVQWHTVSLLTAVQSLLLALMLIRLSVYVLRNIFSEARWLRLWERSLVAVIWLLYALYATGQLSAIQSFLESLSFRIGRHSLTALTVLNGVVSITMTLLLSMWMGKGLERRLLKSSMFDSSLRVVFAKACRALLLVAGLMIALPLVGIDLTLLSVVGGAVGVGVGFGLQKIASNYVSGFVILLDRSIRMGDLLTIEGRYGQVSRVTARYVVLKSLDGTESLIPNETLITSVVVNHSYTDPRVRLALPITISYRSDFDKARAILLEACARQSRVLIEPEPSVAILATAAEGINLELGFWIADPDQGQALLKSALFEYILKAFPAAGVDIPYPKLEIRRMREK